MRIPKVLVVLVASAFSLQAQAQDCDRSCLAGFLDSYLNALAANDASLAPLSHGFRQTENSVVTPNDEGLWSTVTALGELLRAVNRFDGLIFTFDDGRSTKPAATSILRSASGGQNDGSSGSGI
jgi:hypothetical protein